MVNHGSRGSYMSLHRINFEDRDALLRIYDAVGEGRGQFSCADLGAMIPYSQWLRRMSNNGWFNKSPSTASTAVWSFTDKARKLIRAYKEEVVIS